jgi:stalled ribosome alternative rescue factor ArfA
VRDDEVVGEIVGSYFDVEEQSEKEKKGKGSKVREKVTVSGN